MKKRLIRILISLAIAVFFVGALFFIFRNSVLHWALDKASLRIHEQSGAQLAIQSATFRGISGLTMNGISLTPGSGDCLLHIDTLSMDLSIWSLMGGTIRLNKLFTTGVDFLVSCKGDTCNYEGLLHPEQKTGEEANYEPGHNKAKNYGNFLRQILDKAFNLAPQQAVLENIRISFRNDTIKRSVRIREFHSDEKSLSGFAEDAETGKEWQCNGLFSQDDRRMHLSVFPTERKSIVPFAQAILGLSMSFDTLKLHLEGYRYSNSKLNAKGLFAITELSVYHKRISDDTVKISSAAFGFIVNAGKNFFEVDSSSTAYLTKIKFNPFLRYETDSGKIYSMKINTESVPATDFFSSLPKGMFDEVRDIAADGKLSFSLDFRLNSLDPDTAIFEAAMKKEKFRIRDFGSSNLLKMRDEFTHYVYEKGRLVRVIPVGPSNPYFTRLEMISPDFVNSVLTSEDGNFFFHQGFNEEAFRKSIIANFKAGKFVRGGSTISMQLVKNVFLTQKKTIARKAEEALLVWLIESNRLYTKERMLEVYMNIIELGPDVYGVGEASHFYFDKTPAEITLPEGIFLASLLPHPKWVKYSFDTLGNLRPHFAGYYKLVSDYLLRRNLISQEEHDSLKPHVALTGPARDIIMPKDTVLEEQFEFENQ